MNNLLFVIGLFFVALLPSQAKAEDLAYPIVLSEETVAPNAAKLDSYIRAWLNCYECTGGELRRVVQSGAAAKLKLQALVDGDTTFLVDRTTEFEAQWTALQGFAAQTGGEFSISQADFVMLQQNRIEFLYKARAAMAINLIP